MKVLFLTPSSFSDNMSGGAICTINNYKSLVHIYGQNNVELFQIKVAKSTNFIGKLNSYIKKLFLKDDILNIYEIVNKSKLFDLVFIDISKFGIIAKKLRMNDYKNKIVTFFHNCEYVYTQDEYKKRNIVLKKLCLRWTYINEISALKYSDTTICLNNRDKSIIFKIYNCTVNFIIPIYMEDRNRSTILLDINSNEKLTLLFIGSAFHANIHGIVWFYKNVIPFVNINLLIVGKGLGFLKESIKSDNVEIYDSVPDLTVFFQRADAMVFPIFEGSGMKVKTCEALMYGKNIIGTKEVFEGYNLDFDKIGACCNTDTEFINYINKYSINFSTVSKYNAYAREVYETQFSLEPNIKLMKAALQA